MKRSFNVVFVSNYINHHQIPFCNAMFRLLEGRFLFIQTEAMEEERVRMGWHEKQRPAYVKCFYEEEESEERMRSVTSERGWKRAGPLCGIARGYTRLGSGRPCPPED